MSGKRSVDVEDVPIGPEFYNANDGLFGRNGGPYGDEIDMQTAEVQRAAREGRAPDFNNLSASPAVLLQNAGQQSANYNATLIAGDDRISLDRVSRNLQAPVVASRNGSVKGAPTAGSNLPKADSSDNSPTENTNA